MRIQPEGEGKTEEEKLNPLFTYGFWTSEYAQKLADIIKTDGGEVKLGYRPRGFEAAGWRTVEIYKFGPGKSPADYKDIVRKLQYEDNQLAQRKGI